MPARSQAQYRFMQAVASGKVKKLPKGLSREDAKEFIAGQSPRGLPERAVGKSKKKDKGK